LELWRLIRGELFKAVTIAINPCAVKSNEYYTTDVFTAQKTIIVLVVRISKKNQSYFICAEGKVKSLEDIGEIVVKNINGIPVYIKKCGRCPFW
jgi:cobalt-zinc-cadmium resistance protein CzcA